MHHRIYTTGPFEPGSDITVGGEEFHHAVRVVRVREGEAVELFDGGGRAAAGSVKSIGQDAVVIATGALIDSRESPLATTLAMAIVALEKFELVLQKATELGVASIVPIVTSRVELRPERYRGKQERWRKIVFEAVKQCGRAAIPRLEPAAEFDEVVARNGVKLFFDADAEPDPLSGRPSAITLFIGPEGGWSDDELRRARAHGCVFQRLGPRRLRAETAAIAALTKTAAAFGDL